ncbi:MAG: AsmA family protein [Rhizobiaceae bacterium]|nr:AsmA family protein [Rhizobiaceae bacterium]
MLVRAFVLIGGLIVLALTAALVGPYFVDWTGYRNDFEREASRILGREVTVDGSATARLLPFPSVTFSDVRVAGGPDGEAAMTVERFSMDAELAPFLSGEILIFDMRLDRPRATVEIGEDGSVDWTARPQAPIGADRITLENVTVTDGVVIVRHVPSGRSHRVTAIDATISARTLAGPWRFDGTAVLDGVPATISVSTGTATDDGMRLRLVARPRDYPVVIETDGDVTVTDDGTKYAGQFRLNSTRPDEEDEARQASRLPDVRLRGLFELDHERLLAPEYVFETGPTEAPYTAEGEASLELGQEPRFRVLADGAQFRFEDDGQEQGGQSLDTRLEALRRLVTHMPRPTIPGRIEVNLPAIVAGDTTIRDIELRAEPATEGWTVRSLSAQLPGRTTLEANGLLRTGGDFGFLGSLLVAVQQPSGFAAWLARDVDEAIRRLPAAGFLATADISAERQLFSNLEIILGASRFNGRVESLTPDGARPSLLAELDGGALDLEGLAAFASLFIGESGQARMGERDVDLELKAGPVSAVGLTAGSVDAALRLREDAVEIDRLTIGDFAGASISATGTLGDLDGARTGSLDASLVAPDLEPLLAELAGRYSDSMVATGLLARAEDFPELFRDARIDVQAKAEDGIGEAVTVAVKGETGDMRFTLNASAPLFADRIGDAPVSLALSAESDDVASMLALYGLPALPLELAGQTSTVLTARGSLEDGLRTRLILSGEEADAAFDGTVRHVDGATTLSGNASLEAEDIEPWLTTTGMSLPGMGLGTPVKLAAKADFEDGVVVFSGLSGEVAGVSLNGDVNGSLASGRPHMTGALQLGALDLALPAAMVLGEGVLGEAARLNETEAAFDAGTEPPFTADMNVATDSLMIGQAAEFTDARFDIALEEQGLRVAELRADWRGGALSGLVELRNSGGSGLVSAQLSLADADLSALFPDGGVSGTGDLGLTVTANGKSISGLAASLGGSGTASLRSLTVEGIDPGAFDALIASADRVGRDIDAEAVADFAPEIIARGRFEAGEADLAVAIANGVMRAPPVRLTTEGAAMTVEGRIDASTGVASVTGEIVYEPGKEAIAGATPAVEFTARGWPGSMEVSYDTGRMAQFLTQRALEIEQARVEAMQMALLEKQRLRREVAYYAERARVRAALEEERLRLERERRLREEERQRREAEEAEEEPIQAEEEARRRAEEEAARAARDDAEPAPPDEEPAPAPAAPDASSGTGSRGDVIERRPLPGASGSLPGVSNDPVVSGSSREQERTPREPDSIFQSIDTLLKEIAPGQ